MAWPKFFSVEEDIAIMDFINLLERIHCVSVATHAGFKIRFGMDEILHNLGTPDKLYVSPDSYKAIEKAFKKI